MATLELNPAGALPILLILGGTVVHQAIARLTRVNANNKVTVTPVCFSFGWIGLIFIILDAALGSRQLFPSVPVVSTLINADSSLGRNNRSWVLNRLLESGESRVQAVDRTDKPPQQSSGNISLVIDVFTTKPSTGGKWSAVSPVWISSVFTIFFQLAISTVPWILHGNIFICLLTVFGYCLAVATASLPQWAAQKWSAARCNKTKPVLLTKGNGHQYVMLVICEPGSWDLETMATARPVYVPGTPWVVCGLVFCWVAFLHCVANVSDGAWYLFAIASIGYVQNCFAAGYPCSSAELDLNLEPHQVCPTIVGYQRHNAAKKLHRKTGFSEKDLKKVNDPETDCRDVMGAIMELEKYFPKAGQALLPVFFPGTEGNGDGMALDGQKVFWKKISGSA